MTAALLVMDPQVGVLERLGDELSTGLLERLPRAIGAAREAGLPVIYARLAFREGSPEISTSNRTFAALAQSADLNAEDPDTQVHTAVAPEPGDVIVIKKRVSAFTGSDLAVVLRAMEVETLVLAGVASSGVVLSTVRQAADRDLRLVVLADGCADSDPEVHRVLTEKVFPRQADVRTIEEWAGQLG